MIQRAHPDARVVKSLNTMNNSLMVDPQRLGEDTTVFVSGDDAEAKATVVQLLRQLGHGDVIDLGGIEHRARSRDVAPAVDPDQPRARRQRLQHQGGARPLAPSMTG